MPPVIPDCQGMARFDTREQAAHVATGHEHEFGTVWQVGAHGDHWHIRDTGQPKEPDRSKPTQGTDHA